MAEQRSPLKEFRHLDEKLRTVGLSGQEQARWEHLRELVSSAAPLKPGFDVKAAAAKLKASLEPAGLRRPAPSPAPAPAPAPLAAQEPGQVAAEDLELEPPAESLPTDQGQDAAALTWEAQPGEAAPPAVEAAAWDPNAAQPADTAAQPYDPSAQPWDAAAQPEGGAAPAWDAAWDPNAQPADPAAQPWDAAAQPEGGAAPAWDAAQAGAAAWDPTAQPADPAAQPYDANAQPWDAAQAGAAALDPSAQPADPAAQPYDPNAQPWDAAAQPEGGAAPAWESAPEAQPAAAPDLAAEEPDAAIPATHDVSAFAASALDFSGGELTPEGSEALNAAAFPPQGIPPADADVWAEAQPDVVELAPSQDPAEAVPPPAVEDAPPLELASAADFLDLAAAAQAAPAPGAGQDAIALDEIEVEELPTVDAEEVLEEAPAAAAAPPPPAHPFLDFPAPTAESAEATEPPLLDAGASASFVAGEHRVVVHTVEGQVLRGSLVDVDLDSAEVPLGGGGGVQLIPASRIKAIFFMLLPGGNPPPPEGKKVRVTFRDGRQVAGFSGDYDERHTGFFMIPADSRTNTGRIWVYRNATRQVSVT